MIKSDNNSGGARQSRRKSKATLLERPRRPGKCHENGVRIATSYV